MRVLSLFDGMACGMLAMQRAGVDVTAYYAYEVDKYAIKTATHNFSQILELGDVFNADFTKYNGIDYLIGGSPCTFWSIAQSPDKRETTASGLGWDLFNQYVRALRESKPKYFLYENNKSMSKGIYDSISETFGFEPICINSALLSAQYRQRLYWIGKRNADSTYSKVDIEQPKDRGIVLKDVLDEMTERGYFKKNQGNMAFEPINTTDDGKTQTIKAQYYKTSLANICKYTSTYGATGVAEPVLNPMQVGALPRPNGELSTSQAFRIYDANAKSVTLKAGGGGAGGKTGLYAIPVEFENGVPTKAVSCSDGKTYTVHEVKGSQITIKGKTYPIKLIDGYYIIRKLTVSECKRLQTVPEWYEFPVSNTQAYKMLGNGWTVDVIAHLIQSIIKKENDK